MLRYYADNSTNQGQEITMFWNRIMLEVSTRGSACMTRLSPFCWINLDFLNDDPWCKVYHWFLRQGFG